MNQEHLRSMIWICLGEIAGLIQVLPSLQSHHSIEIELPLCVSRLIMLYDRLTRIYGEGFPSLLDWGILDEDVIDRFENMKDVLGTNQGPRKERS